jgi:hypothetical protein
VDTFESKQRQQGRPWSKLVLGLAGAGLLLVGSVFACRATEDAVAPTPTPTVATPTPTDVPETPTPTPTQSPTPIPPTPTPTPTAPPTVVPADDLVELQASLQAEVDSYWQPGNYAFAILDLQSGETIGVYGDRQQLAGCITNLFVLLRATLDVQEGRLALAQVDDLIAATTWSSNASTAYQLYGIVGGGDVVEGVRRVGELMAEMGLDSSVIDHPPAFGGFSLSVSTDNWITAADANRALALIWDGDLLNDEWRDYLLAHLENVKPGLNYLTANVPSRVSHKNGFFPYGGGYVDNDAGIVRLVVGEQEYAFAITFLSEEVPVKYADIPLGQTLVRMTYDFFVARYAAGH